MYNTDLANKSDNSYRLCDRVNWKRNAWNPLRDSWVLSSTSLAGMSVKSFQWFVDTRAKTRTSGDSLSLLALVTWTTPEKTKSLSISNEYKHTIRDWKSAIVDRLIVEEKKKKNGLRSNEGYITLAVSATSIQDMWRNKRLVQTTCCVWPLSYINVTPSTGTSHWAKPLRYIRVDLYISMS